MSRRAETHRQHGKEMVPRRRLCSKHQSGEGARGRKVHYLINLTAAAWNAQSDGSPLMLRAGVIYHGERRLTLSLSTPLTFINSVLKDSQTLLVTHTHTKDLWLKGKTLKRRQSINHDTGAFNNLIFQAQLGPPRLASPDAIDKEALTGFCG